MCSLPETQTPLSANFAEENEVKTVKPIFGRLYPKYRPQRCDVRSDGIDLWKYTTTFGRAESCDVILSTREFSKSQLTVLSKIHFSISKECGEPPFILDESKNGTFLNGIAIGKGKRVILQDDDEICLGHLNFKVYVFKSFGSAPSDIPKIVTKNYETSKVLGYGACGEVRLVFAKLTCEQFAMKKIVKGKLVNGKVNSLTDYSKILNEINILKSLSHPCIVKLIEVIDTKSSIFLILEYMEGGELFERIMSYNRLSEDDVKLIFYQIVLAVQYLHEQGITHRDLKPENVLLQSRTPETLIKVADFGLSKIVDNEAFMKTVCGTPTYVAPEIIQTNGQGHYTKQVDVWSMGVILYFALSQKLPFFTKTRESLNELIISGQYTLDIEEFKDVSNGAKDLIKKLLTLVPSERYNINEVLVHPWFNEDVVMQMKVANLMGKSLEEMIDIENNDISNLSVKRPRIDYTTVDTLSENSHLNLNSQF